VPGSAEVSRGVSRLRGTVSGRLSHTKVFHRGVVSMPSYSQSPTVDVDRRLSLSQQPSARRPLVVGWDPRRARTGPIPWLCHRLCADPGRPLSPLLSFVSHIFDSASDRLCRRLSSVRRLHDVDFKTASCRFTHLMDRGLAWTCRSCLAHRACGVQVSRLSG
jgi:hypothetical protein